MPITATAISATRWKARQVPGKPGVIGRLLTEDERNDLIEYLKTL